MTNARRLRLRDCSAAVGRARMAQAQGARRESAREAFVSAIIVYICSDCQALQCGLCIEANETQTPGPGCDCEHEDWPS